jgi:protease-4
MKNERNIPVVVSMGGVAASGGYYVSMVVGDDPNTIFAEPTTWTGSIGVKIPHYDLSKLLKEWGIQEDTIASHKLKTMGSIAKPMTEEEKAIFQTLVDHSFDRFKEVIRSGRPQFEKNPEALDVLATGQVFSSQQALENGLVDKIGYLENAVDRAISLAKVERTEVKVVKYETIPTLFSAFAEGRSQQNQVAELKALLNLNSPRAFYILSWDE